MSESSLNDTLGCVGHRCWVVDVHVNTPSAFLAFLSVRHFSPMFLCFACCFRYLRRFLCCCYPMLCLPCCHRGGEEVQYLQQQGIAVQCVPGITAAAGICAELGIPMTHRGVATSVRFLTGHAREGGQAMVDDTIMAAADPNTTLVVYMGLATLPLLVKQLQQHGMPLDVPAVAVERGTTADQRVVFGTLTDLHDSIQAAQLKSPTLLIIGQVVALAPGWLDWQETASAAAGDVPGAAAAAAAVEVAAARADMVHDCARLQLPDAVAAVLQPQQQQQEKLQLEKLRGR